MHPQTQIVVPIDHRRRAVMLLWKPFQSEKRSRVRAAATSYDAIHGDCFMGFGNELN